MPLLNGRQRRHLRGLGHKLDPVVRVGKEGVTDAVVAATDRALITHELIKIRCGNECPTDRKEVAASLAGASGGEVVQILGRTLLLYRPDPDEPRIDLP